MEEASCLRREHTASDSEVTMLVGVIIGLVIVVAVARALLSWALSD